MKINLAVIGDPIAHSLSPIIHSTVLDELGIDYNYEKIRIAKGALPDFLASEKCLQLRGFNLTMPHKQDCLHHLDFIAPDAKIFESVNTISLKDGKFSGYNTDDQGWLHAVTDTGFCIKDKNIVFFGAGGVVSTIALKAVLEGAKSVVILNRTPSVAKQLAERILIQTGKTVTVDELTLEKMCLYCKQCHLLINGTPLGMEGTGMDFETFDFLKVLSRDVLVNDLIYKPQKTNLLLSAMKLGLETLNGLGMLIYQGLFADEIFLNTTLDFSYFKEKIENNLKYL